MWYKFPLVFILVVLIGCENNNLQLVEEDLYYSDSDIFEGFISKDDQLLFVHLNQGEKRLGTLIDTEKGVPVGSNNFTGLQDALWSNQSTHFLSYNSQGYYEYVEIDGSRKPLEPKFWPTTWSADGKHFYSYQGNQIYRVEVPSLEREEIVFGEQYLLNPKKILFEGMKEMKVIEYNISTIIIVNENNQVRAEFNSVIQDSVKLSPNREMMAFLKFNGTGNDLLVYHLGNGKLYNAPNVEGYNLIWSPENDRILMHDSVNLHLIDITTNNIKTYSYDKHEHILDFAWIKGTRKVALYKRKFFLLFAKDLYKVVDLTDGDEIYEKRVKGVNSGSVEWTSDGRGFYYMPNDKEGERIIKATLSGDL
jgi:hypothetical protein